MKVTVLASGSKGNCTLIESQQSKIIIDVGLSYRNLINKLSEVNVSFQEIDGIFITHEHIDHIQGLAILLKHHQINVFMSHGSYDAIVGHKKIGITYEYFNVIETDEQIKIEDLMISPFLVSHDALEPFGYIVSEDEKKLVYLTDSGYISETNENRIKDADIYILETNHNIEMLMCTNRPWSLKQRILGNNGHLCNEDALNTLNRIVTHRTKYVYLAHISEEANNVDLLLLTVNEIFSKSEHYERIKFIVAKQYELSERSEI